MQLVAGNSRDVEVKSTERRRNEQLNNFQQEKILGSTIEPSSCSYSCELSPMLLLECILFIVLIIHQKVTGAFLFNSLKGDIIPTTRASGSFAVVPVNQHGSNSNHYILALSASDGGDDEGSDEEEPGKMKVSEIKAELKLRGVSFNDCFDKEALVARLQEARYSGKADPEILDKFNKEKVNIFLSHVVLV